MRQLTLSAICVYRRLLARRSLFGVNKFLFLLSLRGMGVLNHGDFSVTGEDHFLRHSVPALLPEERELVVLDVGANEGRYACKVKELHPNASVYAFEPHPGTFARLRQKALEHGFEAVQLACGETRAELELYDFLEHDEGTSCASLYKGVIEQIHRRPSDSWTVPVTNLDRFMEKRGLARVHLLKTDTEGHDLSVIRGAADALRSEALDIVQFEFNEMNVVSRTFFKDFYDLLPAYSFFRMLPDGLVALEDYAPLTHELFAYQNIAAIPRRLLSRGAP